MHQKLYDYGTSNFIVARLFCQTSELINFFDLSLDTKEKVIHVMGKEVMEKLLACYEISQGINDYIENITLNDRRELPSIVDLENKCGLFLDRAKLSLSNLSQLFQLFYNINRIFKNANYDQVYKWCCEKFGKSDEFSDYINNSGKIWIKELVEMRNALEHPEDGTSVLHIKNFSYDVKTNTVSYPMWNLNNIEERPIHIDMKEYIKHILLFAENVLCFLLEKQKTNFPILFCEIPEEQRDVNCPIRLTVVPDIDSMIKKVT